MTVDLLAADSDGELGSETLNSSQSSVSNGSCDSCSSLSRLSFDAEAAAVASKPHRSSDPAWTAIKSRKVAGGLDLSLGAKDFKLIRRIGNGDIGTVYLCKLRDEASPSPLPSPAMYAMKVVDKEVLKKKKKIERAETEKRILKVLDHPFLPTLYAVFDASPNYSCVVMEYCSGGDLHSLRHRQPGHRFSINAARFYAAEVLLALEYLHMLGIVYRDLKPENILIRSDGHIMLSDFDLSLESTSSPILRNVDPPELPDPPADPSCLPFRSKKQPSPVLLSNRRFVAEPVLARSNSFVGTHEYVAPEVASGHQHGSAVDWWAYGVLLYELIYGMTPFVGPTNEATMKNIVKKPLAFPSTSGTADSLARDLIAGLLAKDPTVRLGSSCGAADIKYHPFFKGLNFALLRSCKPPVLPGLNRAASCRAERPKPERFDYF